MNDLAQVRRDYHGDVIDLDQALADPIGLCRQWWDQALETCGVDANAISLATVSADGQPHNRIVLLRGIDTDGFHFFTNYQSAKGQELATQPRAALLAYWPQLDRQVRLEGVVCKVSQAESDRYFAARPYRSQIAACASAQSEPLESRDQLLQQVQQLEQQFPDHISRPVHWGGYALQPHAVEFWQGMPSRLHDRVRLERETSVGLNPQPDGAWRGSRLGP